MVFPVIMVIVVVHVGMLVSVLDVCWHKNVLGLLRTVIGSLVMIGFYKSYLVRYWMIVWMWARWSSVWSTLGSLWASSNILPA